MALDKFTKQSFEEFRISADFGNNFQAKESLVIGSCTVTAADKDGNDVSSTVLDGTTIATADGATSGVALSALQVLVKAGSESESPYKITCQGVTDKGHKWELDVRMVIKNQ